MKHHKCNNSVFYQTVIILNFMQKAISSNLVQLYKGKFICRIYPPPPVKP